MRQSKIFLLLLLLPLPQIAHATGAVVAIEVGSAEPVVADSILKTGEKIAEYVSNENLRVKLAPFSVAEFNAKGELRLLRGSAYLESETEKNLSTVGAGIEFVGKVLLSYDHQERSTSAFVTSGQARLKNPYESDRTVIVDKNHGATMVVGDIYPTLVRQLDITSVDSWLDGYSWPESDRHALLQSFPAQGPVVAEEKTRANFESIKLQDYYAALDEHNERPNYYDKKFSDPDKVMAEAKLLKEKAKQLSPEEAALINLPSTKIDLDLGVPLEFVSAVDKQAELLAHPAEAADRKLASLEKPKVVKVKKVIAPPQREKDPVEAALERLRSTESGTAISKVKQREPSSISSAVPDPVYDFSQNF